jgi:hypothetical protein
VRRDFWGLPPVQQGEGLSVNRRRPFPTRDRKPPAGKQVETRTELSELGFRGESPCAAPQLSYRVQAQGDAGVLAGETLHGLAKRHEVSRDLVRIAWHSEQYCIGITAVRDQSQAVRGPPLPHW